MEYRTAQTAHSRLGDDEGDKDTAGGGVDTNGRRGDRREGASGTRARCANGEEDKGGRNHQIHDDTAEREDEER